MGRQSGVARRFFDRFEPVHGVTYFAPEARAALDGLGFRGFWMGYFAARSAPLGIVPAEVVTALFYSFTPERVTKSLTAAWERRTPAEALWAREESAVAALRRYGVSTDDGNVREAAQLAAKAAGHAALDGRPLFAANVALPWPDAPVATLWHAVTLIREHQGDGHIALLATEGISGRECNVLHAAAGRVPREMIMRSRDYDDEQWNYYRDRLVQRGLLNGDGALTDDEVEALFCSLTPITRKVVAAGDVPAATPMGLGRENLDDDSAHL